MNEMDDFDIDRSTTQAWEEFTARLDEVISVMDSTSDLTILVPRGDDNAPAALIFSVPEHGTVMARIHRGQPDVLTGLGWQRQDTGDFLITHSQEDSAVLAQAAVRGLIQALQVVHPVFLQPDVLAEILNPGLAPQTEPAPVPSTVVVPCDQADLDRIVEEELLHKFGHSPLRNAQGDIAIRVGSAVVFLRTTPDAKEILLFSPLVHDISGGRSRACEVLNDLNMDTRYCRFALHRDQAYVQYSVLAQPLALAHLHQSIDDLTAVVDHIDDQLAAKLGGRTTYPAEPGPAL